MMDLDQFPMYEFHTLYYVFWKEKDQESKMTDEEKSAAALGRVMEEHM